MNSPIFYFNYSLINEFVKQFKNKSFPIKYFILSLSTGSTNEDLSEEICVGSPPHRISLISKEDFLQNVCQSVDWCSNFETLENCKKSCHSVTGWHLFIQF